MIEKVKTPKKEKKAGAGGGSIFDAVPEAAVENKNVSISSGPYAEDLPVAGMTVGGIRTKFADRFDIAAKSQAVLNGNQVDDNTVLKAGEQLMFIQHAGEKGASSISLDGTKATVIGDTGCQMNITDLLQRVGPPISTGPMVLPTGVKAVLSSGPITVLVWERPPCIQQLSWIDKDSENKYGPGTKYRNVIIALPYLIIMSVFQRDNLGLPMLSKSDECFFRNQPLTSLEDELCYPALLNCSKWNNMTDQHPLSWICTQYLKQQAEASCNDANRRYRAGMEAVRYCLLETSFNLSSENHEGNSWFGFSKTQIPKIATVEKWEENTKKDPMFVLDIPWVPTKHTVKQVADRIFHRMGADKKTVKTSDDIARIILNS
jgi:hypothetical protein